MTITSKIRLQSNATKWLLVIACFAVCSCKKWVTENPPANLLASGNVYQTDATAAAVLTGMYDKISSFGFATGSASISVKAGLSADELQLWSGSNNTDLAQYYKNLLTNTSSSFWNELYGYVHTADLAIEGITASTTLTPAVKQQLLGEAKFMRAFLHFYLFNLYGPVPIVTSSDYRINSIISRSDSSQVYLQIINDLKDARNLLSKSYVSADAVTTTTERVRPNYWVATAFLSRVYLYAGDWTNSDSCATTIINNTANYTVLNDITKVFLKNSQESIWQLQPVVANMNTLDGNYFILTSGPSTGKPVLISPILYNSFDSGDIRKTSWIGTYTSGTQSYYYPNKYKVASGSTLSEYLMVLRVAEQFLIRAEALAQLGLFTQAINDLNIVRKRSNPVLYSGALDKNSILKAIYHERQTELFTEWGHRWMDIKRVGLIESVMNNAAGQKASSWNSYQKLYPLPVNEISLNPNLFQNPGY